MSRSTFILSVLLLLTIILVGCSSSELPQQKKSCDSDWICIQDALKACSPTVAQINFQDPNRGRVEGILEVKGPESDTENQIYGCGVNYATNKSTSTYSSKRLKGHMIVEEDDYSNKLIDLILNIEGYLEGSGQVLKDESILEPLRKPNTYVNEYYGVSIEVPEKWTISEGTVINDSKGAKLESPDKKGVILIDRLLMDRRGDGSIMLLMFLNESEVGDLLRENLVKGMGTLLSEAKVKTNNLTAFVFEVKLTNSGIKTKTAYFPSYQGIFMVSFVARSEDAYGIYLEDFEKSLKTVQIAEN